MPVPDFQSLMLPTLKALSDGDRAKLIGAYFRRSGGWGEVEARDISPRVGGYNDPVHVVSATAIDK